MNDAIKAMLARYQCQSTQDYINAFKEIIQEIALLGLWRSKFYEHAAFYGGTALRILYGLDRFSEDLDFSLLKPNKNFSLEKYNQAIEDELRGFGFDVTITLKIKSLDNNIQSAFIKADTAKQLILIETPSQLVKKIHHLPQIKIKMEVDINPPQGFFTEAKYLLLPFPFSVNTYQQPDLFAGKLHAILCRQWQNRVKGRDWYDFVWYISHQTPVRLNHLQERLRQSGHWPNDQDLALHDVKTKLLERIKTLDIQSARHDIQPFIRNHDSIAIWSSDFFENLTHRLQAV